VHVPVPLTLATQVDVVFCVIQHGGPIVSCSYDFLARDLAPRCCPQMLSLTAARTSWVSLGPKHLISGVMKPILYRVSSTKVNEQALRFSFVLSEGSDGSSPLRM